MVVGYEVAHRIGRCWHASRDVYQACGSWGSVACAAVAAHLMRLTPEQAGHALGIAEYHAGNLPMMRDVDDPGMVKHGIGWGAMTGVTAAGLAARGYTGIPTLLAFPEYQEWVERHRPELSDGRRGRLEAGALRLLRLGARRRGGRAASGRKSTASSWMTSPGSSSPAPRAPCGWARGSRPPPRKRSSTRPGRWPRCWWTARSAPRRCWRRGCPIPASVRWPQRWRWWRTPRWNGCAGSTSRAIPSGRFASIVTITLHDGREFHSGVGRRRAALPPAGLGRGAHGREVPLAGGIRAP